MPVEPDMCRGIEMYSAEWRLISALEPLEVASEDHNRVMKVLRQWNWQWMQKKAIEVLWDHGSLCHSLGRISLSDVQQTPEEQEQPETPENSEAQESEAPKNLVVQEESEVEQAGDEGSDTEVDSEVEGKGSVELSDELTCPGVQSGEGEYLPRETHTRSSGAPWPAGIEFHHGTVPLSLEELTPLAHCADAGSNGESTFEIETKTRPRVRDILSRYERRMPSPVEPRQLP
ncbi:hypothetical protein BDY21DRAFT_342664 [Lineolata rhizophorae]|uniref:Uncharacterized protein n=1 Tax=Lineolata rhizophorae TaxID=578093 RepID=A0A6A6P198_9PEZI|nr:hypothetical protein BDY21DRAFT_342664 [Lineolata rhizophorae]